MVLFLCCTVLVAPISIVPTWSSVISSNRVIYKNSFSTIYTVPTEGKEQKIHIQYIYTEWSNGTGIFRGKAIASVGKGFLVINYIWMVGMQL